MRSGNKELDIKSGICSRCDEGSPGLVTKSETHEKEEVKERRDFLLRILGGSGIAALLTAMPAGAKTVESQGVKEAATSDRPETFPEGSILERMRADLKRALKKPVEKRRWVMVIDLKKCIGCKACTVSCVSENNLPPGVVYRPVTIQEIGKYPNVRKTFLPRPCLHCDNPPCVPVCPVKATYKRPDGIVAINYDHCIGCRYCITACPYGARAFDFGEYFEDGTPEIMDYETRPSPEYGGNKVRDPQKKNVSPKGNARKCQFCLHKIENGMLPGCVTTCLGGATYFGDINDKKSLVFELVGSNRTKMRLKEELGTDPSVYYLT